MKRFKDILLILSVIMLVAYMVLRFMKNPYSYLMSSMFMMVFGLRCYLEAIRLRSNNAKFGTIILFMGLLMFVIGVFLTIGSFMGLGSL